jgi:hypothetical protein
VSPVSTQDTRLEHALPAPPPTSRPLLVASLLGLNCWVVCAIAPAWSLARLSTLSSWVLVAAGVALAVLAGGLLLLHRGRGAASLVLVGAFPVVMLAPALIQPTLVRGAVMSPLAVAIVGASFSAFLLGACWACSAVQGQPLRSVAVPLQDAPPRPRKILVPALIVLAGLTAATVIGATHLRAFASGDRQVTILSACALALWVTALFGIIAPAVSHRRPWPLSRPSRGVAFIWLAVVLMGLAMLVFSSMR